MFKLTQRLMTNLGCFRSRLKSAFGFHCDQRGLEALQVVMILAVAAVCLKLVKYYWPVWNEFLSLAIEIFLE